MSGVRRQPVLVTGATGFVGAAIVRALVRHGYRVRAALREQSPEGNLAGLDVERVGADLLKPESLEAAVQDCAAIIHAAADYRLWTPRPEEVYRANVDGTRHLLDAAARTGVGRIVYTGSVATLATDPTDALSDENSEAGLEHMTGHYKRSKWLAEQLVLERTQRGSPAVIVMPSTPFGPGDVKPTPTGKIVLDAISGRMPAFVDTGLNVVHVDDVAEGHVLALERGQVGRRYILGGENLMLRQMLEMVCREAGRHPPRLRLPLAAVAPVAGLCEAAAGLTGRPPLVSLDGVRMARNRMFFSSARAEGELGYRARPARDALADAVAWFSGKAFVQATAIATAGPRLAR